MALTKENIAQLIHLQEQDKVLDALKSSLDKIPGEIQAIQKIIESEKSKLQEVKARSNQLQLAKKEKESEVQAKEAAVRKHGEELNKVKTNDAYKALLAEIEKAKADASDLETRILEIMEQMDQAAKDEKAAAVLLKEDEAKKLREIDALKAKETELKSKFDQEKAKRAGMTTGIPDDASRQYDYLRKRKTDGEALSKISGTACSACRVTVPPQSVVEVAKGRLVTCESCQRILYRDEAAVASSASNATETAGKEKSPPAEQAKTA